MHINKLLLLFLVLMTMMMGCKDDPPPCLTTLCNGYVHMLPPSGSPIDGHITKDGFGALPPDISCAVENGRPKLPGNLEDIARKMTKCEAYKDNSFCACKDICPLSEEILGPIKDNLEYSEANVPTIEMGVMGSEFSLGKLGFIKKMNNFANFKSGEKPSPEAIPAILDQAMSGEIVSIPGFNNLNEFVNHPDYKEAVVSTIRKEQNFRINTLNSLDAYDEFPNEKERNSFLFAQVTKNLNKKQRPILTFPHPVTGDAHAYLATEIKTQENSKIICLHDPTTDYSRNTDCKTNMTLEHDGSFRLKTPDNQNGRSIAQAGLLANQEIDTQRMAELQSAGLSPQEDADYLLAVHAHAKSCKEKMVACQPKSIKENFDRLYVDDTAASIVLTSSKSSVEVQGSKDRVEAVRAIIGNNPSETTLQRISVCNPISPLCALEQTFGNKNDAMRAMVVYKETGFAPTIVEPTESNLAGKTDPLLPSSHIRSPRVNTDVSKLKPDTGELANSESTGMFRKPKMIDGKLDYQTCTATLVAPSVVLVSSACLDDKPDATGAHVLFNSQKGTSISERIKVNCSRVLSLDSKKHLALLQCDGRPGDHFGVTQFSERTPLEKEEVYTVHHPKGDEKSFTTGQVTRHSPEASLVRSNLLIAEGSGGSMVYSAVTHMALGMNFGGSPDRKEGFGVDAKAINEFIQENVPSLETGRRYPAAFESKQ